ncbi:DNA-directed RNA polymerase III subunit RPC5 [Chytridiales sp. JEL 0842]|nr:DNA-directed RNA polymerase III subunit RPC5 [Chytridiales sp. JEL 0842]
MGDEDAPVRRTARSKGKARIVVEDVEDDEDAMEIDQVTNGLVKPDPDSDGDIQMADSTKNRSNGAHHVSPDQDEDDYLNDANDDDADDDPVIREIPIYFSQQLANNLFVFQYPTRKLHQEPLPTPVAARMKPLAQRFELDIPLNIHDEHYSADKGETLGVGMDNEAILTAYDVRRGTNGAPSRNHDGRPKMLDKQTYQSTLVPMPGNYYVGAMRDDEIHLTPLTGFVQLRPTLKYLDKISEKEKAANMRIQQEEAREAGQPTKEEDAKIFQRTIKQSDDKDAMRKLKQGEEEKMYEREEWLPISFLDETTADSTEEYEKLFSLGDELDSNTTKKGYLDGIGPKIESEYSALSAENGKVSIRSGLPLDDISKLSLAYRLKALFMNAHIMQHQKLKTLIEDDISDEELIEELERICVLVRGVWIVRSEVHYTGRVADARRLLLNLFSQNEVVTRKAVNTIANLPYDMITNIFIEIATKENIGYPGTYRPPAPPSKKTRGWTLKVTPDDDFCADHPELVNRQKRVVQSEAEKAIWGMEQSKGKGKTSSDRPYQEPKRDTMGLVVTGTSINIEGAAAATQNGTKEKASSASASAASGSSSGPNVSAYTLIGSTAAQQCENLMKQVFTNHGICSKEYLLNFVLLKKADEADESNMLATEDINAEYVGNILDRIAVALHGRYALRVLNSSIDEFRKPILELFKKKESVKKSDVNAACQNAVGKNPPQNIYTKIMKELATSSGPSWELKQSP